MSTCNGDRLRLESFSADGGVYARLDVLGPALDGEVFDRGTTNVDVNGPLREAPAASGKTTRCTPRLGPADRMERGKCPPAM